MRDLPYIGVIPHVMEAAIQYFFIRIRLNVLTGLLFGTALWLLGVDYAALWGLITVFLSFVPYIGLVLAATPATLLAWAEFGIGRALLVVVLVIVINLVIENVIAPTYTGKELNLSPAVVFVSFFFWVWLLGPLGALLAMPITVLMMLTFSHYEPTRWIAQLIAGEPLSGDALPGAPQSGKA
jgi:predicted PurR-regulated permease PerM